MEIGEAQETKTTFEVIMHPLMRSAMLGAILSCLKTTIVLSYLYTSHFQAQLLMSIG